MKKTLNVLLTGSASGIGAKVAEAFLAEGHSVYGIDIKETKIEGVRGFTADVRDAEALDGIRAELEGEGVLLDVIISVAGVHEMISLVEGEPSHMERLIDINLLGPMNLCRVFHPLLSPSGRVILVTSEVATLAPLPFNGLYTVSKNALEAYAQALRQELGLLGQRVITVRPGAIATPLQDGSIKDTERLAASTRLFSRQASRFSGIARRFMGTPLPPERLARTVLRAATAKHPRLAYNKHRSLGLLLLNLLPLRLQCAVIKLLLGKSGKRV